MEAVSYSSAREHFAATMKQVCDDHEPVIITRAKAPSVVILSLEDYNAMLETAHLLGSPANARRLLAGIDQLQKGHGSVRELPE
jgi:antitoxin YefM